MGLNIPATLPTASVREAKRLNDIRKGYSREGTRIAHTLNGWPHTSSTTGACMCLDRCCLRESGCICRSCSGAGHANCRRAGTPAKTRRTRRVS